MRIMAVLVFVGMFILLGCSADKKQPEQAGLAKEKTAVTSEAVKTKTVVKEPAVQKPLVTFIELGSVNCIPCKMMQPVMKAVEEDYNDKVKVVFYDVWSDAGRPFAKQYSISLIPTQVFLDKDGKEFFRHEGFFPKEDIDKLLKEKGITK